MPYQGIQLMRGRVSIVHLLTTPHSWIKNPIFIKDDDLHNHTYPYTALVHDDERLQCMLNYSNMKMYNLFLLSYDYIAKAQTHHNELIGHWTTSFKRHPKEREIARSNIWMIIQLYACINYWIHCIEPPCLKTCWHECCGKYNSIAHFSMLIWKSSSKEIIPICDVLSTHFHLAV